MPTRRASGSITHTISRAAIPVTDYDNTSETRPLRRRSGANAILLLIVLIGLALGGWKLRAWWLSHQQSIAAGNIAAPATEPDDLQTSLASLRREQHALAQRLSDLAGTDKVLRDEVLGVGERAALLEQSVTRIAGPRAQGEQALRLDEADLLLTIGQQQLQLLGDLPSALHAYALADATLAASPDSNLLDLRQTLAQEIAALRALPADPRATLSGQLDAMQAALDVAPSLTAAPVITATRKPLLDRLFGSMVSVQHRDAGDLLNPSTREAGMTALRLEFTIARLALERRDARAFDASLTRIDAWLPRLFANGGARQQAQSQLTKMRAQPLRIDLPVLGSSLDALRRLRASQPPAAMPMQDPPAAPATNPSATPSNPTGMQ